MAVSSVAPLSPADARGGRAARRATVPNNEWVLLVVIAVECLVFGMAGHNFATAGNAFEITRLGVEIGLLALALTPIIVTGGIDLSVGSMMGLAAVVLGWLWHDVGLPMPVGGRADAAARRRRRRAQRGAHHAAQVPAAHRHARHAVAVSRHRRGGDGRDPALLRIPRRRSSHLGQGYVGGVVPTQLFIFVAAAIAAAWWLHRTSFGRALYAIGHSAEGARYAGIPVSRRLAAVYVLSGLAASLAAVIYVAHLGQAKSDAGTGYELMAITAVVLGGASIFGGRGTVLGTVLGLFSIVLLQNGLRLTGQPAELSGILTGVLLVATIMVDLLSRQAKARPTSHNIIATEQDEVRNSQVAILSAVILAGALIVAASNWMLVKLDAAGLRARRGDVARSRGVGAGRNGGDRREARRRAHAEGQGRPVLHQRAKGRRLRRERARRRAAVGRADRSRSREAERGRRGVDHARRRTRSP